MKWAIFLLVSFGITNALAFLKIGHPWRRLWSGMDDNTWKQRTRLGKLRGFRQNTLGNAVRCHACCSFWIGGGLSLVWWPGPILAWSRAFNAFSAGMAASAFCFVLWMFCRKMGAEEL
jgi:hypothetical protein